MYFDQYATLDKYNDLDSTKGGKYFILRKKGMISKSIFYKKAIPGRKLAIFFDGEDRTSNGQVHCCELMNMFLDDERIPLLYSPIFREYDIFLFYKKKIINLQGINYCPWCSKKLPKSVRKEWFDILKKEYGIDHPRYEEQELLISQEFKTDEWWKKRNL